jgi:ABC-type sugar transport system permease subunit
MSTVTTARPAKSVTTMADKKREETIAAWVFMAPAMIVFVVFLILPIAFALFISFTDWNGITPLGQRASATTGTVLFTNQTNQEITIPEGIIMSRGMAGTYRTTETVTLLNRAGDCADHCR